MSLTHCLCICLACGSGQAIWCGIQEARSFLDLVTTAYNCKEHRCKWACPLNFISKMGTKVFENTNVWDTFAKCEKGMAVINGVFFRQRVPLRVSCLL